MAKSQQKSNKEVRKPKAEKAPKSMHRTRRPRASRSR